MDLALPPADEGREVTLSVTIQQKQPGGQGSKSKQKTADESFLAHAAKQTTFSSFQDLVLDAVKANKPALKLAKTSDISMRGKIAAGGVWKDEKPIDTKATFDSFWSKILKKKQWEAFVFVSCKAVPAASSSSSPSAAPADHDAITISDSEDGDDDELFDDAEDGAGPSIDALVEAQLPSSGAGPSKKRKGPAEAQPPAGGKRGRLQVKNEAEEERKKLAAEILRLYSCNASGHTVCYVVRGGAHVPLDNVAIDRWVASIQHDPVKNSTKLLPHDSFFDKLQQKTKNAARRASAPYNPPSHLLDADEDLYAVFSSSRQATSPEAGPSRLRAYPTAAVDGSTSTDGPDITFEALAKRIKLDKDLTAQMLGAGVKKASAFARVDELKMRACGCREGDLVELLDAQSRWRKIDPSTVTPDELVDSL